MLISTETQEYNFDKKLNIVLNDDFHINSIFKKFNTHLVFGFYSDLHSRFNNFNERNLPQKSLFYFGITEETGHTLLNPVKGLIHLPENTYKDFYKMISKQSKSRLSVKDVKSMTTNFTFNYSFNKLDGHIGLIEALCVQALILDVKAVIIENLDAEFSDSKSKIQFFKTIRKYIENFDIKVVLKTNDIMHLLSSDIIRDNDTNLFDQNSKIEELKNILN